MNIDKLFKDSKGKWVLWQKPNLLLIAWFVAMLLNRALPAGRADRLADLVAFGALFAWAWQEISRGDSYFRRVLGLVVLLAILASRIKV